jgi:hypothetical protein
MGCVLVEEPSSAMATTCRCDDSDMSERVSNTCVRHERRVRTLLTTLR